MVNPNILSFGDNGGRSFKKVYHRSDESLDSDDPIMDDKRIKLIDENATKGSWMDMLLGNSLGSMET